METSNPMKTQAVKRTKHAFCGSERRVIGKYWVGRNVRNEGAAKEREADFLQLADKTVQRSRRPGRPGRVWERRRNLAAFRWLLELRKLRKTSQTWRKGFFWGSFSRHIRIEVYLEIRASWKLCVHSHVSEREVQSHVTSSLQENMPCFVWQKRRQICFYYLKGKILQNAKRKSCKISQDEISYTLHTIHYEHLIVAIISC